MNRPTFIVLLCLLSFNVSAAVTELKAASLTDLKAGKLIQKVEELQNEIWPRVTNMKIIPHSPKQNLEVFAKFERHKEFIPDLVVSKIVKQVSANEFWIEYRMKMPWPVSDSEYTTSNVITQEGESYRIDWRLIKGNQLKATTGTIRFEAFEGKTLFSYTSHITPDSSMAGLFTGRVPKDVEKTFLIIAEHLQNSIQ